MKIVVDKEQKIEANGSVNMRAGKGFELVFKATDCDVDMNLGRIVVRCKHFSVKERKVKKQKSINLKQ